MSEDDSHTREKKERVLKSAQFGSQLEWKQLRARTEGSAVEAMQNPAALNITLKLCCLPPRLINASIHSKTWRTAVLMVQTGLNVIQDIRLREDPWAASATGPKTIY